MKVPPQLWCGWDQIIELNHCVIITTNTEWGTSPVYNWITSQYLRKEEEIDPQENFTLKIYSRSFCADSNI